MLSIAVSVLELCCCQFSLSKESQARLKHHEDLDHNLPPLGFWGKHIPVSYGALTALPHCVPIKISIPPTHLCF